MKVKSISGEKYEGEVNIRGKYVGEVNIRRKVRR